MTVEFFACTGTPCPCFNYISLRYLIEILTVFFFQMDLLFQLFC